MDDQTQGDATLAASSSALCSRSGSRAAQRSDQTRFRPRRPLRHERKRLQKPTEPAVAEGAREHRNARGHASRATIRANPGRLRANARSRATGMSSRRCLRAHRALRIRHAEPTRNARRRTHAERRKRAQPTRAGTETRRPCEGSMTTSGANARRFRHLRPETIGVKRAPPASCRPTVARPELSAESPTLGTSRVPRVGARRPQASRTRASS